MKPRNKTERNYVVWSPAHGVKGATDCVHTARRWACNKDGEKTGKVFLRVLATTYEEVE